MTALHWHDQLAVNHPQMDRTHVEFIALLGAADAALTAAEPALLLAFEALLAHTIDHFAQEEAWMLASGLGADNCHSFQHRAVLQVMHECARRAHDETDFDPLRLAVAELAIWFPPHAQQMDAALARHLVAVGLDAEAGLAPAALAAAATACSR